MTQALCCFRLKWNCWLSRKKSPTKQHMNAMSTCLIVLVVGLLVLISTFVNGWQGYRCTHQMARFYGRCYWVHKASQGVTWDEADAYCTANSAMLATLATPGSITFVMQELKLEGDAWIGLREVTTLIYEWRDPTPYLLFYTYMAWSFLHPFIQLYLQCVSLTLASVWIERPCETLLEHVVCEAPPVTTGLIGYHDDYGLPETMPCLFDANDVAPCLVTNSFNEAPWHFKIRVSLLLPNVSEPSLTISGENLQCLAGETLLYLSATSSGDGFRGDFQRCALTAGSTQTSCTFLCECIAKPCTSVYLWRRQNLGGLDPSWQLKEITAPELSEADICNFPWLLLFTLIPKAYMGKEDAREGPIRHIKIYHNIHGIVGMQFTFGETAGQAFGPLTFGASVIDVYLESNETISTVIQTSPILSTILRSVTFITNLRTHGPFGIVDLTPYYFQGQRLYYTDASWLVLPEVLERLDLHFLYC